ncbi:MAG TPA: DNA-binding response regulator, partial [Gaiellaceae bacterium]|nr:DNA-binding response regulator [Gaiellaceae bacterium]
ALPRLREAAPSCEVVVLTASESEDNLLSAIRAGAAGYLLKSEPPARIVEFLRGVAQGEAADGDQAIEAAGRLAPDLVLLDLSMPGLDGLNALPRLREAAPGCEVVVLTASGTEDNLLGAIRAGAAGYLLKSEPPARIVDFLRGVANGEAALSGAVARRLLERVREGGRDTGVPDEIARVLSARELEVLLLLDDHLGTDEIAKRLFISEHTVRSHVKSLLRKLGVSSRREALEALSVARR